jgi:hypothetical protein
LKTIIMRGTTQVNSCLEEIPVKVKHKSTVAKPYKLVRLQIGQISFLVLRSRETNQGLQLKLYLLKLPHLPIGIRYRFNNSIRINNKPRIAKLLVTPQTVKMQKLLSTKK